MRERERWLAFWASSGARGDPEGEFSALDARYSEPGRFYHTWEHVLNCLRELEGARHICGDPLAVELALWYHDAVYDPRAADNERRSAALAAAAARRMSLGARLAAAVEAMILWTAHSSVPTGGQGAEGGALLVIDIDLAILGRTRRAFAVYEKRIRREYSFVPEDLYRQGRSRVLRAFLDRPRIYRTELFQQRYETRARANIREALAKLGGHSK